MWDKRARVLRVIDGDTIVALLDQGFRNTQEITIRLFGVFAPEMDEPGGIETKAFVEKWVDEQYKTGMKWPFVVTTIRQKSNEKEITTLERYVCTVTDLSGSRSLNMDINSFIAGLGEPVAA